MRRLLNKLTSAHGANVWFGKLNADAEQLANFYSLMSTDERHRAARYATPLLRSRYIETRGRLRGLLANYCNCAPLGLRFAAEAHGKPFLPDYPEIAFNLSHSQHLMALAVGHRCRIGIDIEVIRARACFETLVQRCFAPEELAYWKSLPQAQQAAAFYKLWTQKEAFVKAAGRGIAIGLERCVVATQGPPRFLALPEEYATTGDWQLIVLDLGEDASGALVIGM